ncbi:MAG: 1,2-phenylacetyl-CoA epoxidase subunit PaaD [Armatimonadota bacterium]|nr:1,2-phenylacetyl-CoA epoxidase subunit PaaD [Armatimonadota bacterium]MDR7487052.1 1,2-phenylacetyl-CoA epoxidase subunit PaaD [Armatimonadota bacterium]MDR7532391.1 1,2-phenylacetyl-CoA epoxidase subunit PaaD [Armatimonadota bacterium]MDR7535318.1 1,2-phenylacetyl-CoA epoxidase subunit PaaD [Armatimonadota bacterium]
MADVTRDEVWRVLATVEDPELPVAITDLGLVHTIEIRDGTVRVRLVPTYTGCPALDVIRERVRTRVLALSGVAAADVAFCYDVPWTLDRMTPAARARLHTHGLSVPRETLTEPAACPYCGSANVVLENPFGPTLCRAVYYCRDCRNPVERFKPPGDPVPPGTPAGRRPAG